MMKNALNAIGTATRETFRARGALALASLLYFAMLLLAYYFFATGVASAWQLAVSAFAALFVPLLFFILQAALAHTATGERYARRLARLALRDFWKLIIVSLPLVVLGFGFAYLVGRLEVYVPAPPPSPDPVFLPSGVTPPPPVVTWQQTALATFTFLLFAVVLPLLAARLWLATAREGLKRTFRNLHRVAGRSFAPQSVFIYSVGLLVFGAMPYFIIFTRTPVENGWLELFLFGLRLALAFIFTLWGWTLTLAALAHISPPLTPTTEDAVREKPNDEADAPDADAPSTDDGAQQPARA